MITIKGRQYTLVAFIHAASSVLYYELLRPIAWLPSRLVFGNFIGYRNNIVPLARYWVRRFVLPAKRRPADPLGIAGSLAKNGYALLPRERVYSGQRAREVLRAITEKIEACIKKNDSILTRVNGRIFALYDPLAKIPELRELITDDIDRALRAYYCGPYRMKSVSVWRNQYVPHQDPARDAGIANAFHHDGSPRMDLRLFVLLTDNVNKETGALRFHDKATSKVISSMFGYFSRSRQSSAVKRRLQGLETLQFFEGDIGDACLVNTQECLHAAGIPRQGAHRDVVQFEIAPASDERSKDEIYRDMPEDPQVNPRVLPYRKV